MTIRTLIFAAMIGLCPVALADDRDDARERMPKVIEWHGHYLVLHGENFLPVERGLATPNITIFEVEPDYLPTGRTTLETRIEGCNPNQTPHQSVTDTGVAEAALTAEAAIDHASAEAARDRQQQHCPESLGKIYGSGSNVYDRDFNNLAGQEFDDGTEAWLAWFLYGETEEPKNILIVGQGGAKRSSDPALDIYSYDNGMIVDVLFDPNTYNGRQEPGLGDSGVAPAPELPVTVTFDGWFKETVEIGDDGFTELGQVTAALNRALAEATRRLSETPDALIVSRGGVPDTFDAAEDRLEAIKQTVQSHLGPGSVVSSVSLGVAVPVCSDEDPSCWFLNRSTLLYLLPK